MGKAKRNKKLDGSDIQRQTAFIRQDTTNTLVMFLAAKYLQDEEFQNILAAEAGKLVQLDCDVNLVDTELNAYAANVQALQRALVQKQEDDSCSKLKN